MGKKMPTPAGNGDKNIGNGKKKELPCCNKAA